jgi:hypothetical protein
MDRMRRKGRKANGDVFRGFIRRRVLNPFPGTGYHRLTRSDIEYTALMAHAQLPSNHYGVLLKIGRLPWLLPSRGAAHVRDADALAFRVHAANEFINDLRHVSRRLDASGALNVRRQSWSPCGSPFQADGACAYEIASPIASAKRYHIGFSILVLEHSFYLGGS